MLLRYYYAAALPIFQFTYFAAIHIISPQQRERQLRAFPATFSRDKMKRIIARHFSMPAIYAFEVFPHFHAFFAFCGLRRLLLIRCFLLPSPAFSLLKYLRRWAQIGHTEV